MSLSARARQFFMFSIWGSNQSQLQPFCRNPAHTQRLWTGVWCYFPGWANCLWGSVLSLWLLLDFALLHDAAVDAWECSNEDLWEAGCLLAVEGGMQGGHWKMEDGSEAEKGEEWSVRRRRERACSETERWMDGRKASRSGCTRETQYWLKAVQTKSLLKLSGFPSRVHYTHFICSVMCL